MISKKHKKVGPLLLSRLAGVAMAITQAHFWVKEHDRAGFMLRFFSFLAVVESIMLMGDKTVRGPFGGHHGRGDELHIAAATRDPMGHDSFINPPDHK